MSVSFSQLCVFGMKPVFLPHLVCQHWHWVGYSNMAGYHNYDDLVIAVGLMFQIQFLHANICFQYDLDLFARTRLKYLCAHCIVWNLSNPNLLPFPTPMCPKGTGIGAKHSFKKRNWGNTFFCTATIFILGYWMLKNATAVDMLPEGKNSVKQKGSHKWAIDCVFWRSCLPKYTHDPGRPCFICSVSL